MLATKARSCILLAGLSCAILVWWPGPPYRPEQFIWPKEVALGITGLLCSIGAMWHRRLVIVPRIDAPLVALFLWSCTLALAVAEDHHAGWRSIGSLGSAISVFLLARQNDEAGANWYIEVVTCGLLGALSCAMLLEAMGAVPFFSEPGRRPGAMLGNRNSAARLLVLGLPLVWKRLVVAGTRVSKCALASIISTIIAAVVMARSRGAWLVGMLVLSLLPAASLALARAHIHRQEVRSLSWWFVSAALGILAATAMPNRMYWTFGELQSSLRRSLDAKHGTGRERVLQAVTTWRIVVDNPITGVGPGNWSRAYADYAAQDDPSLTPQALFPAPPVPRGDVHGFAAEVGLPGLIVAVFVAGGIVSGARRATRCSACDIRSSAIAAIAIVFATLAFGLIDPVLRLPPSLCFVAVVVGVELSTVRKFFGASAAPNYFRSGVVALGVTGLLTATDAMRDIAALRVVSSMRTFGDLYLAVRLAPDNVEVRSLLGAALVKVDRCDLAVPHLARAQERVPRSGALRLLKSRCLPPHFRRT